VETKQSLSRAWSGPGDGVLERINVERGATYVVIESSVPSLVTWIVGTVFCGGWCNSTCCTGDMML
jgi:hypothetical protein